MKLFYTKQEISDDINSIFRHFPGTRFRYIKFLCGLDGIGLELISHDTLEVTYFNQTFPITISDED